MKPFYHRRSVRLPGHDYASPGAYFVTICTRNREFLFGEIVDGQMKLNDMGKMVHKTWAALTRHYPGINLDAFVVMPNHIHAIILVVGARFIAPYHIAPYHIAPYRFAPTGLVAIGEIVRGFKARVTFAWNKEQQTQGISFWQRNYHDQVIRNDEELQRKRRYIKDNPEHWLYDPDNPAKISSS